MILDLVYQHNDYIKDILPYTKEGIFIDTSVLKIFIDGLVELRFQKKQNYDYDNLIVFFEKIYIKNKWQKFFITPHVFTEMCSHVNVSYNKRNDYKKIIEEILPVFKDMREKLVMKGDILNYKDVINPNPCIEIGDISIFVASDLEFVNQGKKISILVKDKKFNEEYKNNPNVMVMDFFSIP